MRLGVRGINRILGESILRWIVLCLVSMATLDRRRAGLARLGKILAASQFKLNIIHVVFHLRVATVL